MANTALHIIIVDFMFQIRKILNDCAGMDHYSFYNITTYPLSSIKAYSYRIPSTYSQCSYSSCLATAMYIHLYSSKQCSLQIN